MFETIIYAESEKGSKMDVNMKTRSMSFQLALFLAVLFAFDSYGYELVEERLTVTPQCTGGVSYCVIESGFLSSMSEFMALCPEANGILSDIKFLDCLTSISSYSSSAGAKAYSTDGRKNSNVMLSSDHSYYLCNDSDKPCSFRVKTKLSTHDHHSSEHDQVFILKPKEYVRTSKHLYLNKSYSEPGSYTIYASTDISLSASSSADDTATVTIR